MGGASAAVVLLGVMRTGVRCRLAACHRSLKAHNPSVWIAYVRLEHVPVLRREGHGEIRRALGCECAGVGDSEDRMRLEPALVLLGDEDIRSAGRVHPLPGAVIRLEDVLETHRSPEGSGRAVVPGFDVEAEKALSCHLCVPSVSSRSAPDMPTVPLQRSPTA